ncbi:MAG: hypothetical protein V5B33_14240 [Candidatus Accumulibacter sp. UW20]
MSLAERGLLDTLRRECWVNVGVPAKPAALARMLGYESAEIDAALPAIMPFFRITQDGLIVCPELDDLRAAYADRRERQAAGGKRSAEKRKGIKPENGADDIPSTLQGTSKHPAGSLQVRRQDQTRPDQSKAVYRKEVVPCAAYKDWMAGDADADAYRRASGGD